MSDYTEHYNLKKPAQSENYNVDDANTNNTIIDKVLYEKVDKTPGKGLSTNDFTDGYKKKLDLLKNYDDTILKTQISNIKAEQTTQNEYIKELESENQRLKQDLNGLPSGTAEGETIDITDSAEMRFSKLNISGNSKQETREGYNELLNTAKRYTTDKGIIATFKEDGTIIVSGTATGTVDIQLCGEWASTVEQFKLTAGNYKYTSNNTGLKLYLANNTSAIYFSDNEVKALEDYSVTNAFIRIENGVTINSTIKPMLYLYQGTEREYEQYGASPSPEYSSEVESCGDNVNLFDKETVTTGKYVDYSKGTFTAKEGYCISDYIEINFKNITVSGTNEQLAFYDKNKTYISGLSTAKITSIPTNAKYMIISLKTTEIDSVKVEAGKKATLYTPYGQGCITEVICNKNLAKILNGIWYNSTTQTFTTDIQGYGYMTKIKENSKITISKKNTGNRFVVITSKEEIAVNGTYSRAVFLESEGKTTKYTFTTQENEKYVFFGYYRGTDEDAKNLASQEIQIEISEVKTGYEVHKEQVYTIPTQQPFRTCGDYADTFVKKNNKWFERHSIARKMFDGTEDWEYSYNCFRLIDNSAAVSNSSEKGDLKSNNFKADTQLNLQNAIVDYGISTRAGFGGFVIRYKDITVLAEFKAWLTSQYNAGTPVYVDYVLAEPLDIECTEEQSTILWDIEQNAKTYDKVTHIYSTDEISANVKITYKKDIETINKKQDDRITALEELLSSTVTSAMLLDNMQNDLESEVI